ncbi:hypothetical protein BO83DRAFT_425985 [Aspergillus eucalypticola CBS 122712]|uniref:Uncharacterized protein n=1 Tax=Aspergillus eucalypticola (strain CBS 122712 / IBT 29274) TaxID=1448314 RepID=A0A317VMZ5_ASPEC|nr:uncharacterized protein BO83DRAFT_425985 [Aspergillus eucalypticola CBS 122712]PWY75703.1 hypothetical protein BO83DRAFT_425985 [Aspergillus eucalypticola CBS 122712]
MSRTIINRMASDHCRDRTLKPAARSIRTSPPGQPQFPPNAQCPPSKRYPAGQNRYIASSQPGDGEIPLTTLSSGILTAANPGHARSIVWNHSSGIPRKNSNTHSSTDGWGHSRRGRSLPMPPGLPQQPVMEAWAGNAYQMQYMQQIQPMEMGQAPASNGDETTQAPADMVSIWLKMHI